MARYSTRYAARDTRLHANVEAGDLVNARGGGGGDGGHHVVQQRDDARERSLDEEGDLCGVTVCDDSVTAV